MILTFLNLRHNPVYIPQYVAMRNKYKSKLKSKAVTVASTKEWISLKVGEIWVGKKFEMAVDIYGAVVIRNTGEVTVFHNGKIRGFGALLIKHAAENIKDYIPLSYLWAWTDKANKKSRALFKRCGYKEAVYFRKDLK